MRKIFITYCDFPVGHKARVLYEEKTKPRFIEYCKIHDFEFIEISENVAKPYNLGFAKVFWIKQNMPNLNDGDVVTYMDIDCCIIDFRQPAIFDADFSIVMESTGVLCMGGTWSVRISDWSRRFINEMCSSERQETNKFLESWKIWHENDAIYHVLGLEWGQPMSEIGTRNTTPFTKDSLDQHVKILGTEWGTTFNPDDTPIDDNCFWIYKIIARYFRPELYKSMNDIIVRHLSAGTMFEPWANKYFNFKIL